MPAPPRQGTSPKRRDSRAPLEASRRREPQAPLEAGALHGRGLRAPLEAAEFKRGPGGRPTREEAERRHGALLATAFRLFLDKGWDGVSVEEIARQSGVAKGFIYARYSDKAALFVGAVAHLMEAAIGTLHAAGPLPEDVEEGLLAFGRKLLGLALQPDALACHRQFIAEAPRFPGLAQLFLERNRVLDTIVEVLATYVKRGALDIGDAGLAAEHFAILVVGVPRMLALLVGREAPAAEERRLRAAVRLFLDGCRAAGDDQAEGCTS
jgi:TetR/AcrR family transcriptional regulator, mexJK operon transcriptional repressor